MFDTKEFDRQRNQAHQTLKSAEKDKNSRMHQAVFIDRDDTICKDVGYCRRPDDMELLPGSAEGIKSFNEKGFKVVVITNQSGIARGYFNEETLARIHEKMKNDLHRSGAYIDAIYCCPHHPEDGCSCRKPEPELGRRAIRDLDIDPAGSFVIGDRLKDILFGKSLGAKSILISNPKGLEELRVAGISPDFVAADLEDAADLVQKQATL